MARPNDIPVQLFLSRRNLVTLLNKLDDEDSKKTLIKMDTVHPKYPLRGTGCVYITAVEDEEYYTEREPGPCKHAPELGE